MVKENYDHAFYQSGKAPPTSTIPLPIKQPITQGVSNPLKMYPNVPQIAQWINDRPSAYTWCNDAVTLIPDDPTKVSITPSNIPSTQIAKGGYMNTETQALGWNSPIANYTTLNQSLSGPANPKTLIDPVIVPPALDLDYWKVNNLVTHSHVNDMKQIDDYRSGYAVSTLCGANDQNMRMIDTEPVLYSYYTDKGKTPQQYKHNNYWTYETENINTENNGIFKKNGDKVENSADVVVVPTQREDFVYSGVEKFAMPKMMVYPEMPDQMNTQCGYHPEQLYNNGLPSNQTTTSCERQPSLTEYNTQVHTSTIEPNVYVYNQINDPVLSNYGIDYAQQLEPLTAHTSPAGTSVEFVRHDPRLFGKPAEVPRKETVNEANVYDPRQTGYGTNYRAYENEFLGRTDFFYDDINSVRMPNYIVRSKIDHLPFADTYGAPQTQNGNEFNDKIRNLAEEAWLANNLLHRTNLQEGYVHQLRAGEWQQRMMPQNFSMR